ncbi:MAG: alpha/beta fold hydrolase [Deltaproteobacteria bacterium]|nr:alpha/beta fold hydrolase [Deltaproteobacteria bacterium]
MIFIPSGEINLEAGLGRGEPNRGAVVAHPHPQYGGSMHDYVVSIALSALADAGWTTLRFNFRGVGQSEGSFDNGVGEAEDLAAAAAYLKENGASQPLVAGYSFGAAIAVQAWARLKELEVRPLILIALPAAFMSFDSLEPEIDIGLIVCGGRDYIAPPERVRELGRNLAKPVEPVIIPEADHFFGGCEQELTEALKTYLKEIEG